MSEKEELEKWKRRYSGRTRLEREFEGAGEHVIIMWALVPKAFYQNVCTAAKIVQLSSKERIGFPKSNTLVEVQEAHSNGG
ncbi:hypothetical protein DPMN_111779, partial [Dreissena polymorpha]